MQGKFEFDVKSIETRDRISLSNELLNFLGAPKEIIFYKSPKKNIVMMDTKMEKGKLLGVAPIEKPNRIVIPKGVCQILGVREKDKIALIRVDDIDFPGRIAVVKLTRDMMLNILAAY